ncbi:putative ABC transport system ATP-binding protein [Haloactinospora alba]|uniref:Putative ABC transport system ATP-binding protein n=1 Tax=Haloactinospora alba TaxID=405555 RepID=A0A543N6W5_9ACTN|nr:ATP-binding cassette domain-containing protein [Haloactinospora alba]TQN27562.1 putative ABC transport system ATP-binding protein [Haloactinospora alba]
MIRTAQLTKSFGERTLWQGVDLTLPSGRMLALVGPSGSGKTTLLNCLGLLEKPSSGDILHGEKSLTHLGAGGRRRFRKAHLGYLFQNYALMENATVRQNLDLARRDRERQAHALERVGLAGRGGEKVHRMSGGEQQRIALARLMVKQPSLVLADEPTGALDEGNGRMVIDTLRQMAHEGCTVVVATHKEDVRDGCDDAFDVHTQCLSVAV